MTLGLVAVTAVGAVGLWFLGLRFLGTPANDSDTEEALVLGLMILAIAVLGGLRLSHYGWRNVVRLDADERGDRVSIGVWRPLGFEVVDARSADLVDWRYEVGRRNTRMPIHRFRARIEDGARTLLFEISPRVEIHPVFRRMAAPAVEEFEQQTGIAYLRDKQDTAD